MKLTLEQKQIIKNKFKGERSKRQHFFIPSQQDILQDREFSLYFPHYSLNKALEDKFIIPFVPYYDL